jgi:DNA mismatch repair ATPase MutL
LATVVIWHLWIDCPTQADDQLALLQHNTQLYLVDVGALTRDLFYQLLLTRWQSCQVMQLAQPLPVQQLMAAALQLEEAAGRWQVCVSSPTSM